MQAFAPFTTPIAVLALVLATGLWLSRLGKPLNGAVFNLHKLLALAAVVLAFLRLRQSPALAAPHGTALLLLGAAALGVLTLFITGALMSLNRPRYTLLLRLHNLAPFLAVLALALLVAG